MEQRSINFEQYKVFFHVATALSFSKAAETLYISQSAVSQAIRFLEKQLGTPLFARTTKQVRLTQAGQTLLHHIEQACHFIELGERALSDLQGLQRGEIRLGASDTICRYYLLDALSKFKKLYPPIKITLINRPSPVCVNLLKAGSVDFSIVNMTDRLADPLLTFSPLLSVQDILVAAPAYPLSLPKPLPLEKLLDYPLILLEKHSTTRQHIDGFLARQNLFLSPEIELGSLDLCLDFAKHGLGLTFAVREFIESELRAGTLQEVKLATPLPPRQLGLLTHSRLPLPAAAQKFCELL